MILSDIIKSKEKQSDNLTLNKEYMKELISSAKQLKSTKSAFILMKKKKLESVRSKFECTSNTNFKFTKANLINYIININLTPTNTLVNITDASGHPKMAFSSGSVGLAKHQKKMQPMALIHIFRALLTKSKFLRDKPVALHFKNTKAYFEFLLVKALKGHLYIKSIQSYNLSPHNGCRPKKLKRFKRRTKRLVLR